MSFDNTSIENFEESAPKHKKFEPDPSETHIFIIMGATGNFAVNCLLPSLWLLYKHGYLPPNSTVIGFSRSQFTNKGYEEKICPYFRFTADERGLMQCFFKHVIYFRGSCECRKDIQELNSKFQEIGRDKTVHLIYHLSLPPHLYEISTKLIKEEAMSVRGTTKIAIEQPYARDMISFQNLKSTLLANFDPESIFLQDHYLGKEMILSILSLRFGNTILESVWNKSKIASVFVNVEEKADASGSELFDQYGIIKSEIMSHMMQIIALIAMAKPPIFNNESLKRAKAKVLSQILEIRLEDVVLGQYKGNPEGNEEEKLSYRAHPHIDENSLTPTFAVVVAFIGNESWRGVPFIYRSGKAMKDTKSEIRIQFKEPHDNIFTTKPVRNELVIHFNPGASIYLKMMLKTPGMESNLEKVVLNLSYSSKHKNIKLPNCFARLLYEMLSDKRENFSTFEEIQEIFRVFTPVLKEIEKKQLDPLPYVRGSNGPAAAMELIYGNNYIDKDHRHPKPLYEL